MNTEIMSYQLKSIKIELQTWGEYKGKYIGKIEFANKESEAFMFNLEPGESDKFLALISQKLKDTASQLGNKLLQSVTLLPESKHEVINTLD